MGAENFVNDQVGKRSARRSRVLLAATLETPQGDFDARLRDLSRQGALVEFNGDLPAGTEVTFVRGRIRIPARIAWSAGGRVGLEFEYEIDETKMLVQLKRKCSETVNDRYLREPATPMTARQRKIAEAWGATIGLSLPVS